MSKRKITRDAAIKRLEEIKALGRARQAKRRAKVKKTLTKSTPPNTR